MAKIVDHSLISRRNLVWIAVGVAFFLLLMISEVYRYYRIHAIDPVNTFFDLMIAFVLVERAKPRYDYELDKRFFRVTKYTLLGNIRYYEVPLSDVFGVYKYKAKLIGVVKFRRTFRLHSALDGRAVWTMAYSVINSSGKRENRRIYFKASSEMLAALKERLPGKVQLSEEKTVVEMVKSEG